MVGYTRNDIELWTEVMARACTGAGIGKTDIVQNIYGYGLFTGGLGTHYGAMRVGGTGRARSRSDTAFPRDSWRSAVAAARRGSETACICRREARPATAAA